MINPKYAVKCLKLGFMRYQRYRKLPITIDVSKNTISFYAKNRTMEKGKNARVSNHHLSMGRFAEKNEPWLCDNISIVFIVPGSPQDKRLRPRLYQNAEGSIKEFDVTTYPYNPNLLEPNDLSVIFQAIAKYLERGVYDDPFKGTDKEATPMPRHSNIKPYKGRAKKLGEGVLRLDNALLNEIGQFCVSQYLLLNEYNQNNCNRNMKNKKVVRLTESQLHNIIAESVSQILMELDYDNPKASKRKGWQESPKKRPEHFNGDKYWEDEPKPNLKDGDYFTEGLEEGVLGDLYDKAYDKIYYNLPWIKKQYKDLEAQQRARRKANREEQWRKEDEEKAFRKQQNDDWEARQRQRAREKTHPEWNEREMQRYNYLKNDTKYNGMYRGMSNQEANDFKNGRW